jgi:nucleoside-diphosphate-sugar epimerase
MCRKVAVAKLTGDPVVEIWGDGEQTRSFCYIDDLRGGHLPAHAIGPCGSAQPRAETV